MRQDRGDTPRNYAPRPACRAPPAGKVPRNRRCPTATAAARSQVQLLFRLDDRAAAILRAAATSVALVVLNRVLRIILEAVVVRDLGAGGDILDRFDPNAAARNKGFRVGIA